jgi:hypothetical protein
MDIFTKSEESKLSKVTTSNSSMFEPETVLIDMQIVVDIIAFKEIRSQNHVIVLVVDVSEHVNYTP